MSRPARNRTLPSVSTSCCTGVDRLERDRRRQDRTRPAAAGHGPVDLPPGTRPRPDGGQARHRGHPCPAERHAGTAPVHLCRTPPQAGRPHRPDPDQRPPGPQPRHLAAGQIGHCAPRTGPGDGRVASRPHSPTGRAGRAGWEDASHVPVAGSGPRFGTEARAPLPRSVDGGPGVPRVPGEQGRVRLRARCRDRRLVDGRRVGRPRWGPHRVPCVPEPQRGLQVMTPGRPLPARSAVRCTDPRVRPSRPSPSAACPARGCTPPHP